MRKHLAFVVFAGLVANSQVVNTKPVAPRFRDVAEEVGLTVSHISSKDKQYIVESMSGGVGFIDCDNDGKLDILTVNGSTLDDFRKGGDPMVTLYHQDSGFKFSDITKSAGLTHKGWGMGVAVGDYDDDGLPDIYVTGYGGNALYRNLGNCKFEDVTEKAGVGGGGFSTGAAWGDYDRDGHLDLLRLALCALRHRQPPRIRQRCQDLPLQRNSSAVRALGPARRVRLSVSQSRGWDF